MINIDDLYTKQKEKDKKKKEIYEEVLKKCHHRIKTTAETYPEACYCNYIIPQFIYGIPLYNSVECTRYLLEHLSKNGFKVYYTHPNLLIISWKKSDINKEQNNPPPKKITYEKGKYKSIEDYKPSGNLIYNSNSLELLNKKKNNLFN